MTKWKDVGTGKKIIYAVVCGVLFDILLLCIFILTSEQCKSWLCQAIAQNPPWIILTGLAAAPPTMLLWHWREKHKQISEQSTKEAHRLKQEELDIASRAMISSRISTAIQQLSDDSQIVQKGGVYALESISRESASSYWNAIEVLVGWIREDRSREDADVILEENAGKERKQHKRPPFAIEAAIEVLQRRNYKNEGEKDRINLSRTYLPRANLKEMLLERAYLKKCFLWKADLTGANLRGADLRGTDLTEAILIGTDLRDVTYKSQSIEPVPGKPGVLTMKDDIVLKGALYNDPKMLPVGIDPEKHDMIHVA